MTLPASGPLKLSEIRGEFSGPTPVKLSQYYRNGAYVSSNNTNVPTSGTIKVSNFYGAQDQFLFTISSNYTTTQDLRTLALAAGWDSTIPVVATIASGVVLRGTPGTGAATNSAAAGTDGSAALTISGSFPNGVYLTNNGTLVGGGGGGGGGGNWGGGAAGGSGGAGLAISVAVSITNNGTIAGGGGGGGGGGAYGTGGIGYGGGGGGGGAGYGTGGGGGLANGQGLGGSTGALSTGGAGGTGDAGWNNGGAGGAWGAAGANGSAGSTSAGAGGAKGYAVAGNSNVTWVASGTLYGGLTG